MKNAAGNYIIPSDDSFAAAAASADWKSAKDFYLIVTNAPGEQAWPITATNFILMYSTRMAAPAPRARRNSSAGSTPMATAPATSLGYVPLPDTLVQQIETYWSQNLK